MATVRIPRVLSIAGSDSGGGAGIQADLKAFAACGVHGMTAITAITAQNTVAVTGVHAVPAAMIEAQVGAVVDDIGVDAVKIGMLGTSETVAAVARALDRLDPSVPVVLDPVMVAESGASLLVEEARAALVAQLFSRVLVVTPNLPEARAICGFGDATEEGHRGGGAGRTGRGDADDTADADDAGDTDDADDTDAEALVRRLRDLGPRVAIITGGHRRVSSDLFFDGEQLVELTGERHDNASAHGSGCTHSSVLAARLAWGDDPLTAARAARAAAGFAVAGALVDIGSGPGPVDLLGIGSPRRSLDDRESGSAPGPTAHTDLANTDLGHTDAVGGLSRVSGLP